MTEQKQNHPVFIVLRDWTKTNKGNKPIVAETHTHKNKKKETNQ